MPSPPEVEAARREVFELFGHTILRFQKLELLIKNLVDHSHLRIEGPVAMKSNQLAPKTPLGSATEALFQKVLLAMEYDPEASPVPTPHDKVSMEVRFIVALSAERQQAWAARLKLLIDSRNELVHHSLRRMDLNSVEGCQAVAGELQQLGKKIEVENENLLRLIRHRSESGKRSVQALMDELDATRSTDSGETNSD